MCPMIKRYLLNSESFAIDFRSPLQSFLVVRAQTPFGRAAEYLTYRARGSPSIFRVSAFGKSN